MTVNPLHALLLEPVVIGPVTAPNRFYQVPHCTGMGYRMPRTLAAMRGVKAEGGWGVVCTEYCSIHPSSDDTPYPHASLWDDEDVRAMAGVADAVHAHGSLAGVELWHGGGRSANLYSRLAPLGPDSRPVAGFDPLQGRAMDLADIRALRRWHRDAARRAVDAGFDVVYVYAAHDYLVARFLDPATNTRTDAYGGSVANRVRLLRELIEETGEALAGRAAVAVRWAADDPCAPAGERREMFSLLAELPDLWDVTVADYGHEMGSSRFVEPGSLEPLLDWVRPLTTKPVVSVGRFTSPDAMAAQVRRGVMDLVGAARPSIADPFLPRKVAEGRSDDIRECIGCNVCYAGDARGVPIRCTQNPAMGEEWRRGWHPERVPRARSRTPVLVVGAGPAGLECAQALAAAGCRVTLAEAGEEPGGRVRRESRLPGLAAWSRVSEWRLQRLRRDPAVTLYPASRLAAGDVLDFAATETGGARVVIATGSRWRRDGLGRHQPRPLAAIDPAAVVLTPDDVMDGTAPGGSVMVYDDDHYYLGPALALQLAGAGARVTLATPAALVGAWSANTNEQPAVHRALLEAGVTVQTSRRLVALGAGTARLACVHGGPDSEVEAGASVLVTARLPSDELFTALRDRIEAERPAGVHGLYRAGDCLAPGSIAHAVHDGHRVARALAAGEDPDAAAPFLREHAAP